MEIKSSKAVSISEASEILAKRKEQGELGYEQSQALDNSQKYTIGNEKNDKIVKTLTENSKISQSLAIKIVDIRPDNPATLRAILVKDKVDLSEDEMNAVLKELA